MNFEGEVYNYKAEGNLATSLKPWTSTFRLAQNCFFGDFIDGLFVEGDLAFICSVFCFIDRVFLVCYFSFY